MFSNRLVKKKNTTLELHQKKVDLSFIQTK